MKEHGGVYFVTSRSFGVSHLESAEMALKGGIRIIQYREKEADTGVMVEEAGRIKELCNSYRAIFIVDDRVDVAMAVGSDGVHLGQEDMPLRIARRMMPDKIIGVSAKTPEQAIEAEKDGATYLGVGAVFPTTTKVKTTVIGMGGFTKVRESTGLPVYAIGGLNIGHIRELRGLGADGIAVITAVIASKDPQKAAEALVKEWRESKP
ncbi:MAG: thiamine phosphate synthase [Candidatus Micrarchaeota archaeon]|nr:thiamine phosphate synthase [Candidatus Micrarchaeota archaeon]